MIKYQFSEIGSRHRQQPRDQVSQVVFPKPWPSRPLPLPIYINASTGTAVSSVNGTLVIHIQANSYSSKGVNSNSNLTTTHNNNFSTSTLSYEQLSREFYQSYDPSIGLHTAAVLGGILLWLLLYLIYKSKIRKCLVHLIKRIFGEEQESSIGIKSSDGDKDCSSDNNNSNNNSIIRNLVNPSIVIEASPPQSQPQSPFAHDQFNPDGQDCLSPYSLPGCGPEDGIIFKFPNPDQAALYQEQFQCHSPCCLDPHDLLHHLPKSEMDIRSATAQWVQNMPLASRSQQDFAGLMLSLRSHGLLAMNKPCSCPLVCPRTPQPIPLLDLPHTWNNSLPVLSNSLSSQILSAYEAVINQTKENDIKNLVNTTRTWMSSKDKQDNNNTTDHTTFLDKTDKENVDPLIPPKNCERRRDKKKLSKLGQTMYNEHTRLLKKVALARSSRPIPVTPTVTVQNSNPAYRNHSNTSISSSLSADALLAPTHSPFPRVSRPRVSHLPSPHLLSPMCDNRGRSGSKHYSRSYVDLSGSPRQEATISRSVSSQLCDINHEACSFKYRGSRTPSDSNPCPLNNSYRSLCSSNNSLTAASLMHSNPCRWSQQCRSFSDSNCGMADSSTNSHSQLNPSFSILKHQRSVSADVTFSMNLQRENGSPTYSNESNKTSLGNSSRSHSPSPYLLQVPDPHNLFRPVTPDNGINQKYSDLSPNGPRLSTRHYVHSDGNIAYNTGHRLPLLSQIDTLRRHSAFSAGAEEIHLSLCYDNTVRPSSSMESSGTHGSSRRHSHLPHQDNKRLPQSHHQSTGMLRQDNSRRQGCGLFSQTNLSRSYSAVVMETKL